MAVSSSPTMFFELLMTLPNSDYLMVVFHDQSFETKKEPNHAYCLRFYGKKQLWYIQDPMKHLTATNSILYIKQDNRDKIRSFLRKCFRMNIYRCKSMNNHAHQNDIKYLTTVLDKEVDEITN